MTITPIQTAAYGRLFRSRLEARCAVFLTTLGLEWQYEPEGFELPSGRYLPDFKVIDPGKVSGFYWVECKAVEPTDREIQLARELSSGTKAGVAFFSHRLLEEVLYESQSMRETCTWMRHGRFIPSDMGHFWWARNSIAGGEHWVQYWDRLSVVDQEPGGLEAAGPTWDLNLAYPAATAALQQRFEHGETP